MLGILPQLDIEIVMSEDEWLDDNGDSVTRGEFLLVLQSVTALLLPLNLGGNTVRYVISSKICSSDHKLHLYSLRRSLAS